MNLIIRDAAERDICVIIRLRKQLDEYHAKLRPDLFVSAEKRIRVSRRQIILAAYTANHFTSDNIYYVN